MPCKVRERLGNGEETKETEESKESEEETDKVFSSVSSVSLDSLDSCRRTRSTFFAVARTSTASVNEKSSMISPTLAAGIVREGRVVGNNIEEAEDEEDAEDSEEISSESFDSSASFVSSILALRMYPSRGGGTSLKMYSPFSSVWVSRTMS